MCAHLDEQNTVLYGKLSLLKEISKIAMMTR